MQRVIYVEGDTERVILKKVLGVHPKVEIFNPWQHKIEGKLRKLETTARKVEITIQTNYLKQGRVSGSLYCI